MILFILRVELDKLENFTIEKPYCTFIGYLNTFYLKKIINKSRLETYQLVMSQGNFTFSFIETIPEIMQSTWSWPLRMKQDGEKISELF